MSAEQTDLYVKADGEPECYVRTEAFTLNEARSLAARHAQETIGNWGRSRYVGRRSVPLHDHDEWEGCEECPAVPVWVFELYEGTYRR